MPEQRPLRIGAQTIKFWTAGDTKQETVGYQWFQILWRRVGWYLGVIGIGPIHYIPRFERPSSKPAKRGGQIC